MEPTTNDTVTNKANKRSDKKPRRGYGKFIVLASVVAVIVLAAVGLIWSGLLYVGFKTPEQTVSVNNHICDGDIDSLNNLRVSSDEQAAIITKTHDIAKKINQKTDNQTDINCQYILWYDAKLARDIPTMQKSFSRIEKLSDEGQILSDKFYSITSMNDMKNTTDYWASLGKGVK